VAAIESNGGYWTVIGLSPVVVGMTANGLISDASGWVHRRPLWARQQTPAPRSAIGIYRPLWDARHESRKGT